MAEVTVLRTSRSTVDHVNVKLMEIYGDRVVVKIVSSKQPDRIESLRVGDQVDAKLVFEIEELGV